VARLLVTRDQPLPALTCGSDGRAVDFEPVTVDGTRSLGSARLCLVEARAFLCVRAGLAAAVAVL